MYIPNVSYHEVSVAGWACFDFIFVPAGGPPNGDSGWRLSDLCDGVGKHHWLYLVIHDTEIRPKWSRIASDS